MLGRVRSRLSYANVVSSIALFMALGGAGAYAANEWTGANIVDESLTGLDVKNGALYSHDVANDSLRGYDIVESSLAKVPDADQLDGKDSSHFATAASVDELRDDAWGYIVGEGFHASSGNLTVKHPATGVYCVVVSERYSHKAAQVTSTDPSNARVVSAGTGHGSLCNDLDTTTHDAVPVYVRKTDGTLIDGWFSIYIPPK